MQRMVMGPDTVTMTGKAEIRAWVDSMKTDPELRVESEIISVEGETVTLEVKTWMQYSVQLGIAPVVATEVVTVRDGKIQSYTWTISEESLAAMTAAVAALPQTAAGRSPSRRYWWGWAAWPSPAVVLTEDWQCSNGTLSRDCQSCRKEVMPEEKARCLKLLNADIPNLVRR